MHLEDLRNSMGSGSDLVARGRRALARVTDDQTYFGVCKIATLVFVILVFSNFGLKVMHWLASGK
jgi:hypothetical protein